MRTITDRYHKNTNIRVPATELQYFYKIVKQKCKKTFDRCEKKILKRNVIWMAYILHIITVSVMANLVKLFNLSRLLQSQIKDSVGNPVGFVLDNANFAIILIQPDKPKWLIRSCSIKGMFVKNTAPPRMSVRKQFC